MPRSRTTLALLTHVAILAGVAESSPAAEQPKPLLTFLDRHCTECHDDETQKGDLNLLDLKLEPGGRQNFATWLRVFDRVEDGEMPPAKKPRPAATETERFLGALKSPLLSADKAHRAKHGRVQSRRLTRVEYEHTLHDLLGIGIPLKTLLPEDPLSHGFETVADGQQLSHHHMGRYLEAADAALTEAFSRALEENTTFRRDYSPKELTDNKKGGNYRGPDLRDGRSISWPLSLQFFGRMPITRVPASGWYEITLSEVQAINPGKDGAVWGTLRSGRCASNAPILYPVGLVEATAKKRDLLFKAWIEKGHMLELKPNDATLKRPKTGATGGNVSFAGRDLAKQGYSGIAHSGISLRRIYPFGTSPKVKQNLFGKIDPESIPAPAAKQVANRLLNRFATRAFRRPVDAEQLAPYRDLVRDSLKAGDTLPAALKIGYRALLCSPRFLTFGEAPGPLDDYGIASRLSYLLWDSLPDEELIDAAAQHTLRDPNTLGTQFDRMLADPKSQRFVESFTDQWLNLRDIDFTSPDRRMFSSFDVVVKHSMLAETRAYVAEMISGNLGVSHFIDSDFAMLNGRLARHYQIDAMPEPGGGIQRQRLDDPKRGGLMTQGAILKVTANGTNTSPVTRGVWVNERLLGRHIPPPPDNVPAVEPDIRGAVSIRDQLDKHRSQESCNACHRTIDPAGFALENFDPVGRWRSKYGRDGKSGAKIDPTGVTPAGESFDDIRGWKDVYMSKPEMLAHNFTAQLLTYATGAAIRFSDRDDVDTIVSKAKTDDYGVRSIIRAAVLSPVFLNN